MQALINITSTEPYRSEGGMRVIEMSIKPWDKPEARIVLDIYPDNNDDSKKERWEILCEDVSVSGYEGLPQYIAPGTQLKVFDEHPALWPLGNEIFFSVSSRPATSIEQLMGDLFIEHSKSCGNWVDFGSLYGSLPETLQTLRKNKLSVPEKLEQTCFPILRRHSVKYKITSLQKPQEKYRLLLFGNDSIWPDLQNYYQRYVIASRFLANRLR